VIDQEWRRTVDDLNARCAQQDKDISILQRKCQSLEQSLKDLKRERACECRSKSSPAKHNGPPSPSSSPDPKAQVLVTEPPPHPHTVQFSSPSLSGSSSSPPQSPPLPSHKPHSLSTPAEVHTIDGSKDNSSALSTQLRNPAPLKLTPTASSLFIGDSNLKNVNPKRLSAKGDVQVRTYRGAKASDLRRVLAATKPVSTVKRVILHIGTNDVASARNFNVDAFVAEYSTLLDVAQNTFPEAKIGVSAIPPQRPWAKSRIVRTLNVALRDLCKDIGATNLPHETLWREDESGMLNPDLLGDKVHLSNLGLGLLLRDCKPFLVGKAETRDRDVIDRADHFPPLSAPGSYANAAQSKGQTKDLKHSDQSGISLTAGQSSALSNVNQESVSERVSEPERRLAAGHVGVGGARDNEQGMQPGLQGLFYPGVNQHRPVPNPYYFYNQSPQESVMRAQQAPPTHFPPPPPHLPPPSPYFRPGSYPSTMQSGPIHGPAFPMYPPQWYPDQHNRAPVLAYVY
jgi:hypothetical protein